MNLRALAAPAIVGLAITLHPAQSNAAPASDPEHSDARAAAPDTDAGYKLAPGPHRAGLEDLTLHDNTRDKDLEIRVRFPSDAKAGDRFPLVVFSHGAGGSKSAFPELTEHWASHGYVVVLPTHSDSIQKRRREGEDLSRLRQNPRSLVRDVDPSDRLADVRLILDQLGTIEDRIPALREPPPQIAGDPTKAHTPAPDAGSKRGSGVDARAGRIDRDRIAMAGHSAGAYTTQIAFGVKVRGPRLAGGLTPRDVGDERFKAAIVISGQGLTNLSFTRDSWSELSKPMLVIAGSKDVSRISNETPQSRREPFELARPGDKYLLFIEGATHSSYAGKAAGMLPGESPTTPIDVITNSVSSCTLAFLDAYLDRDEQASAYLAGDALARLSGGASELSRK